MGSRGNSGYPGGPGASRAAGQEKNTLSRRVLAFAFLATVSGSALAADPPSAPSSGTNLQAQFDGTVKPFVGKYCVACHSGPQPTAQFDLKSYTTLDQVKEDFPRWNLLADRLTNHEMP